MICSLSEIAKALGLSEIKNGQWPVETLLIDSRSLVYPDRTLFFALRTRANDGHKYIPDLYKAGVRMFVVREDYQPSPDMDDAAFLPVSDTLEALQRVGAMARNATRAEVVAIAGSRGKTSVKEWLFQALEPLREVARSPRSYNSQIGVPLSLWEVANVTDTGIIETGATKPGEMPRLQKLVEPKVVIMTGIDFEHLDSFDSKLQKCQELLSLASGPQTDLLIYNSDNSLISQEAEKLACKRFSWSKRFPEADLYLEDFESEGGDTLLHFRYEGKSFATTLHSREATDIDNAMSVLAYLLCAGVAPQQAAERLEALQPMGTRLDVTEGVNDCLLITDSYTSDFPSLVQAIDFMRRRAEHQPMTVVLSDLRHEAGQPTDASSIAKLLRHFGVRRFIGVGPDLKVHADAFDSNSLFFNTTDELLEALSTSDFVDEAILLKGAPQFGFQRIRERLEARKHETVLEVNLDAIVDNYNYFRRHLPRTCGLIAMVKASGYGAGSYEVAKTMQDHGAAYLAVAVLDEGIDLRRRGIDMPIMVMNPKVVNYRSMFSNRLEPEIYSMEMLCDVIRESEKCGITDYPIHIKLDTGMHRMGFVEEELPALMELLRKSKGVRVRSVFSHLATSDCPDMDDYTLLQLKRFHDWTEYMLAHSEQPFLRHVLNSAGILRFPEHHYDMARLGIGLYGANTLPPEMEKPLAVVSSLRTVIISIREWEAGETIGYGRRGVLQRRSRIATIPIGYADGMNRHFGRGAVSVAVNGKMCPTVGNICMDACMIDVTDVECRVGDSVEIFGEQAPLSRLSDCLDTIPYEILTSVSPRVKRVYYRE